MEIIIHQHINVSCEILEAVFLPNDAQLNKYLHQHIKK